MADELQRWRLILGNPAEPHTGGLSGDMAARDAALEWLYGRDEDRQRRGVRRGGLAPGDTDDAAEDGSDGGRGAGLGPSRVTTVDWLDSVHRLFPRQTIERLERDAVERYHIQEVVTDPAVLEQIQPNPVLLRAVLRTKHLMNPEVLRLARRIVEAVVADLLRRLRPKLRQTFTGSRSRRPSRLPDSRNFDFRATIRANLGRYRPEEKRIHIERPRFRSRNRPHLNPLQLILLVDQSGSMAGSVIHSAVTAACLWGLPGLKTHLITFDTSVVDLTAEITDPVELLMSVQLGGGTDIARAVGYGADLIDNPRRAVVVVISDLYEGGDANRLLHTVNRLVEQGTEVLALAALDEDATPDYDRRLARRLADRGARVGAMTPDRLAEFVAERIGH